MYFHARIPCQFLPVPVQMNHFIDHSFSLGQRIESLTPEERTRAVDLDDIDLVLRACLSIDEMRDAGSFFTGQKLASNVVDMLVTPITKESIVLDPNCGAGNLLIECSRKLAVQLFLSDTLKIWADVLWGFDIYHSFVESTKLRLIIEAMRRGAEKDCSLEEAMVFFKNIKVLDAMTVTDGCLENVTHLVMNPPFSIWPSPKKHYWKIGKLNAAAIVFDYYLRAVPEGTAISAVLPDVLRSGSRYKCFRDFASQNFEGVCKIWGRFNSKTDVDVFVLSGIKRKDVSGALPWFSSPLQKNPVLGDFYDVRTGPLVAYRDPEVGNEYAYFHPKNSPVWATVSKPTEFRRFSGTVVKGPFVLIKRTSSPTDKYRASATLINLNCFMAIENHMVVVTPKSGLLSDCIQLLKHLKADETNAFLNERIRMRHLTVGVVREIPLLQDS